MMIVRSALFAVGILLAITALEHFPPGWSGGIAGIGYAIAFQATQHKRGTR